MDDGAWDPTCFTVEEIAGNRDSLLRAASHCADTDMGTAIELRQIAGRWDAMLTVKAS